LFPPYVRGIVSDQHCLRTDPTVTSCATGCGRTVISIHETFWDFSNRVYRLPLTRDTLLSLQDSHGLDANLLLFCSWYAHTRGRLDPATIQQALAISQPWAEQVVRPLRAARRWMKLNPSVQIYPASTEATMTARQQQLRDQIKALELQAEHLQEDMLESLSQRAGAVPPDVPTTLETQVMDAVHNHQRLLEASAVPLNDEVNELLASLVTATLFMPAMEVM